jgi:CubicO group peptidase (beta-lactamase class C family)
MGQQTYEGAAAAKESAALGSSGLQGFCSPGFERLRDAFARNFQEHGEVGADLALFVGGELVLELWGGAADPDEGRSWNRETVACVWSASKGVIAAAYTMLIDRGLADFEDKVAKHWPEFGTAGKQDVTIGMLLAHQAGLTGFTSPATLADVFAGDAAAERLAAQAPIWEPGAGFGYHGISIGPLATYLFKRIEGRSIAQFVEDELEGPFGLDLTVGLPASKRRNAAAMVAPATIDSAKMAATNAAQRAMHNPPMRGDMANRPDFQSADLPSANVFSNARSLATLYDLMLPHSGGRSFAKLAAIERAAACRSDGIDLVKDCPTRWSAAGFLLNVGDMYGPNRQTFGGSGWGGSFAFADPAADLAVGYVMNHMSGLMDANPRRRNLIEAVYACVR